MPRKKRLFPLIFLFVAYSFLAACSSPVIESPPLYQGPCTLAPRRATSKPYQINGIWYCPQPHYEYEEIGIASYYGGGDVFHGRPTATGETFDMNGITAAHKTLPLPCIVEVVNLENGRQLNLKVNDRGPFIAGRIIDVSRRVAQLLGFEGKGTARVKVRTLVPETLALNSKGTHPVMVAQAPSQSIDVVPAAYPPARQAKSAPSIASLIDAAIPASTTRASPPQKSSPPSSKAAYTGIFVDVGGYTTPAHAQQVSEALTKATNIPTQSIEKRGQNPYFVRVGPFPSLSGANQVLDQLTGTGHTSRLVMLYP